MYANCELWMSAASTSFTRTLLHIYRKRSNSTENVPLLEKKKNRIQIQPIRTDEHYAHETKEKNEK